eukprot:m51a1_g9103 hypothetical protein (2661) ;mRNA; f:80368-91152
MASKKLEPCAVPQTPDPRMTMAESKREPIRVAVRIRPLSAKEKADNEYDYLSVENETTVCARQRVPGQTRYDTRKFMFSSVLGPEVGQSELFTRTVSPMILEWAKGFPTLIFAYGITKSGKTFTINGPINDPGIVPRTIDTVFRALDKARNTEQLASVANTLALAVAAEARTPVRPAAKRTAVIVEDDDIVDVDVVEEESLTSDLDLSPTSSEVEVSTVSSLPQAQAAAVMNEQAVVEKFASLLDVQNFDYAVALSYVEVYLEDVIDLLEDSDSKKGKDIQTDARGKINIRGLKEFVVATSDEAHRMIKMGENRRKTGETLSNERSSRSHAILTFKLIKYPKGERFDLADDSTYHSAALTVVDLAGAERQEKSGATGQKLKEASGINNSLSTFRRCIEVLRKNQNERQNSPVPFRDSKLTRLFQEFFASNGEALMIANVHPASREMQETVAALQFCSEAREISTVARIDNKRIVPKPKPAATPAAAAPPSLSPEPPQMDEEYADATKEDLLRAIQQLQLKVHCVGSALVADSTPLVRAAEHNALQLARSQVEAERRKYNTVVALLLQHVAAASSTAAAAAGAGAGAAEVARARERLREAERRYDEVRARVGDMQVELLQTKQALSESDSQNTRLIAENKKLLSEVNLRAMDVNRHWEGKADEIRVQAEANVRMEMQSLRSQMDREKGEHRAERANLIARIHGLERELASARDGAKEEVETMRCAALPVPSPLPSMPSRQPSLDIRPFADCGTPGALCAVSSASMCAVEQQGEGSALETPMAGRRASSRSENTEQLASVANPLALAVAAEARTPVRPAAKRTAVIVEDDDIVDVDVVEEESLTSDLDLSPTSSEVEVSTVSSLPQAQAAAVMNEQAVVEKFASLLDVQNFDYAVALSYVEVYLEDVIDLLEDSDSKKGKDIQTDARGKINIRGLKEFVVATSDEAHRMIKMGENRRKTGETLSNERSSRSHAILTFKLIKYPKGERFDLADDSTYHSAALTVVDLAGAERQEKSGATGQKLKEASGINNSLSTFRRCIEVLRKNQNERQNSPVPFRDSKLTRLFQEFFASNGEALMIANVHPASREMQETVAALQFCSEAREISTVARIDNKRIVPKPKPAATPAAAAPPSLSPEPPQMDEEYADATKEDLLRAIQQLQLKVHCVGSALVADSTPLVRAAEHNALQLARSQVEAERRKYNTVVALLLQHVAAASSTAAAAAGAGAGAAEVARARERLREAERRYDEVRARVGDMQVELLQTKQALSESDSQNTRLIAENKKLLSEVNLRAMDVNRHWEGKADEIRVQAEANVRMEMQSLRSQMDREKGEHRAERANLIARIHGLERELASARDGAKEEVETMRCAALPVPSPLPSMPSRQPSLDIRPFADCGTPGALCAVSSASMCAVEQQGEGSALETPMAGRRASSRSEYVVSPRPGRSPPVSPIHPRPLEPAFAVEEVVFAAASQKKRQPARRHGKRPSGDGDNGGEQQQQQQQLDGSADDGDDDEQQEEAAKPKGKKKRAAAQKKRAGKAAAGAAQSSESESEGEGKKQQHKAAAGGRAKKGAKRAAKKRSSSEMSAEDEQQQAPKEAEQQQQQQQQQPEKKAKRPAYSLRTLTMRDVIALWKSSLPDTEVAPPSGAVVSFSNIVCTGLEVANVQHSRLPSDRSLPRLSVSLIATLDCSMAWKHRASSGSPNATEGNVTATLVAAPVSATASVYATGGLPGGAKLDACTCGSGGDVNITGGETSEAGAEDDIEVALGQSMCQTFLCGYARDLVESEESGPTASFMLLSDLIRAQPPAAPTNETLPPVSNDSVSWASNGFIRAAEYLVNDVVGVDIVNDVMLAVTNMTGAASKPLGEAMGQAINGALSSNGLIGPYFVHWSSQWIDVRGAATWNELSAMHPDMANDNYTLFHRIGLGNISINLTYNVKVDHPSGDLKQCVRVGVHWKNAWAAVRTRLLLNGTYLSSLTSPMLMQPACLLNALFDPFQYSPVTLTSGYMNGTTVGSDGFFITIEFPGNAEFEATDRELAPIVDAVSAAFTDAYYSSSALLASATFLPNLLNHYNGLIPLGVGLLPGILNISGNCTYMPETDTPGAIDKTATIAVFLTLGGYCVIHCLGMALYGMWQRRRLAEATKDSEVSLSTMTTVASPPPCASDKGADRPNCNGSSSSSNGSPDLKRIDSNDGRVKEARDELVWYQPSLINHPDLYLWVRYLLPFIILMNFAIFVSSNRAIGASVFPVVKLGNTWSHHFSSLFDFGLVNTIRDMWTARVYPLSILVAVFSGGWPYLKLFIMIVSWSIPPALLSVSKRELVLMFLDAFGKWSLVDAYVMTLFLVAFRFNFPIPERDGQPETGGSLDIFVSARAGFTMFLIATRLSAVLGHTIVALHRYVARIAVARSHAEAAKKRGLDVDAIEGEQKRLIPLRSMAFVRGTRLWQLWQIVVAVALVLSLAMVLYGVIVESVEFKIGGAAGLALKLSGQSDVRRFSLCEMGLKVPDSSEEPYSFTSIVIVLAFIVTAILVPLAHLVILLVLWLLPLPARRQRHLFVSAEILNAWCAVEVYVVSIIIAMAEIRQFSQFILGDGCDVVNIYLEKLLDVPLGGNDICFEVRALILPGTWVLLAACVLYMTATGVIMRRCHKALRDREEPDLDELEARLKGRA